MSKTVDLKGIKAYDFSFYFLDKSTADVYFVCGPENGESADILPAHKTILSSQSAVFKEMFFGVVADETVIRITDATEKGFKEFLQLFYIDNATITIENAAEVLQHAKKYEVDVYFNVYSDFLQQKLTVNEMCMGLDLAIKFGMEELKRSCQSKIVDKYIEFFASDGFTGCSSSVLRSIMKPVEMKSHSLELFLGCFQWARNSWKCQNATFNEPTMSDVRQQMGDHFELIGFESMTCQTISMILCEYNDLFTKLDLAHIHKILAAKCSASM